MTAAEPQWPEWMKAGVRVVRGPDWQLPTQDPKEGDLGTLIYVPKKVGDNKVSVVWDSGKERMYQSGASGKYELRAFDIAQVGIVHTGIKCTTCSVNPIRGMRWSCLECNNVELCSRCYMDDKHNVKHSFVRRETLKSEPVSVGKRADAKPVQASGIFENSKVIRGPHWRYKNQDGEEHFHNKRRGKSKFYICINSVKPSYRMLYCKDKCLVSSGHLVSIMHFS